MTGWSLPIEPDETHGPLFLRLAHAVMRDIRRGRLRAGQRLPGTRTWARQLGVNRHTVMAALKELEAQGWLTTTRGSGTFVSRDIPHETAAAKPAGLAKLGIRIHEAPAFLSERSFSVPLDALALSAGTPDPRLVPTELLARTWRRVVRRGGRRLLEYGDPAGHPALRKALADYVAEVRAVPASPEQVVVTRGSQMALDLLARTVVRPGDVVAVEALGYQPAWEALRLAGAQLVPIPVDGEGLDVAALAKLVRRRQVRAIYVTPHHQYPTTVTLSAARRIALLDLASRHRFLIIEDDYDHEFHFDGRPVLPLASADPSGVVASIGTLSKVLAPGLRLGFLVAPTELTERVVRVRAAMDRQGDHPMEAAVAELFEEGEMQRHMRKMRNVYRARRDALDTALTAHLADTLSWKRPSGGISLWAKVTRALDLTAWLDRARRRGVWVNPGVRYTFSGVEPGALRLVFARFDASELTRGVKVLADALPRAGRRV